MEINDLLVHTKRNGASDLHIASGFPPITRINGEMVPMNIDPISPESLKNMLYSIMTEHQRATYEKDFEIDFSIQLGDSLRFRVNAYNTLHGPSAALRVIPTDIKTLEELEMPEILKKISMLKKGLVLVAGPTGSGKSTTLAAMIDYINTGMSKHILTIEDPVEFVHQSKKSLVSQRELETSTKSFANALRSALRQDPDVILVGELRDLETIELALSAAETGHLVMGTLHTSSAAKTVDRIIDAFPAGERSLIMSMLSTSLEAVIAQTLIRTVDGKGRVAALELLLGTPAVRNLIRENKLPQINSLMQVGSKIGMRTMKDSVYGLLEKGIISADAARSALNEREEEDTSDNIKSNPSVGSKKSMGFSSSHKNSNNSDF